jgi:hypothetical protein
MPIQDGVNGAASGDFFDFAWQSSKEAIADLAGAPCGYSRLAATMASICSGSWLA